MIQNDIDNKLRSIYYKMTELDNEKEKLLETLNHLKTPKNVLEEYLHLSFNRPTSKNKKRKDIEKRMQEISSKYFSLDKDLIIAKNYFSKAKELLELQDTYAITEKFLNKNILIIYDFLKNESFIEQDIESTEIKLTYKGSLANHLREIHCLVFANILEEKTLENCETNQLVAIFSCFTNITTSNETRAIVPYSEDKKVQNIILDLIKMYEAYMKMEGDIDTGTDYNMHFDLINYVIEWCNAENIEECKVVLQKMEREKEIFLGEFVKALLKINNISNEMEKIAENIGSIEFLSKLKKIPEMTLKFVATNQSLYI
jgi:hypothetical protein